MTRSSLKRPAAFRAPSSAPMTSRKVGGRVAVAMSALHRGEPLDELDYAVDGVENLGRRVGVGDLHGVLPLEKALEGDHREGVDDPAGDERRVRLQLALVSLFDVLAADVVEDGLL